MSSNSGAGQILAGPWARRIATSVFASADPGEQANILKCLVVDKDHLTRLAAAQTMGSLLVQRFCDIYPLLFSWCMDPNPYVRRAVVMVAAIGARAGRLEWAELLLSLLEPLLSDRTKEVRLVLGPKALAYDFFSAYPDETFDCLACWSTSSIDQVLWNVAMALSGPEAAKRIRKALIILRKLALDERRYVRGAVVAALRRLCQFQPKAVTAELTGWLDGERGWVANVVLRPR